jgi:hypothetical protein
VLAEFLSERSARAATALEALLLFFGCAAAFDAGDSTPLSQVPRGSLRRSPLSRVVSFRAEPLSGTLGPWTWGEM